MLFGLVSLLLVLVILIQKPKGGGLSGAFGGSGGSQAVFGAKAGDVLTWFTVGVFVVFLLLAAVLAHLTAPGENLGEAGSDPLSNVPPATAPASTNTPATSPSS